MKNNTIHCSRCFGVVSEDGTLPIVDDHVCRPVVVIERCKRCHAKTREDGKLHHLPHCEQIGWSEVETQVRLDLEELGEKIAKHRTECLGLQGCCDIDDVAEQLFAEVHRLYGIYETWEAGDRRRAGDLLVFDDPSKPPGTP